MNTNDKLRELIRSPLSSAVAVSLDDRDAAAVSIAVSLKRIADTLDAATNVARFP